MSGHDTEATNRTGRPRRAAAIHTRSVIGDTVARRTLVAGVRPYCKSVVADSAGQCLRDRRAVPGWIGELGADGAVQSVVLTYVYLNKLGFHHDHS
jgi:hypothetical protein